MPESDQPVWFNFSDLGWDHWTPISPVEMDIIWHGTMSMVNNNDVESCRAMLAMTKIRLIREAQRNEITEQWITTALMCAAMDGLLDGKIPRYRVT